MSLQPAFFLKKTPPNDVISLDDLRVWVINERYAKLRRHRLVWVGIGCLILAVLIFYLIPKAYRARELEQDGIVTSAVITRYWVEPAPSNNGTTRLYQIEYQFMDDFGKKYSGSGSVSAQQFMQIVQRRLRNIDIRYLASNPALNERTGAASYYSLLEFVVGAVGIGLLTCVGGWLYHTFWLFPKLDDEKAQMQLLTGTIMERSGKKVTLRTRSYIYLTIVYEFTLPATSQAYQWEESWPRPDLDVNKNKLFGVDLLPIGGKQATLQASMYPSVGSVVYVKYIDDGNFELL